MSNGALLAFQDVSVHFPEPTGPRDWVRGRFSRPSRVVLDRVSFEVRPGEVVALLGANGAGKSTLLRVAQGLVEPVGGARTCAVTPSLGLADERSFHWRLTVSENLRLFADLQGAPRENIPRLLDEAGLADRADTPVRACSSGMRARLGMARALLRSPVLLLLDEVERGLDPVARDGLWASLSSRRGGAQGTLVATHDPASAQCFTRAVLLESGRIAYDGAPADAFDRLRRVAA